MQCLHLVFPRAGVLMRRLMVQGSFSSVGSYWGKDESKHARSWERAGDGREGGRGVETR